MPKLKIIVGMPMRPNSLVHERAHAAFLAASQMSDMIHIRSKSSLLTHNFNRIWAAAMTLALRDQSVQFCALIHDDVCPDTYGWADVMIEEMIKKKLDMLSAAVPMKDDTGETSTAWDAEPGYPDWRPERFTLQEMHQSKETVIDHRLLLNTGLCVIKLSRKFMGEKPIFFRQTDRVALNIEGTQYVVDTISEDWDFTRQVKSRGGVVGVTRKVALFHEHERFHNRSVWGTSCRCQDQPSQSNSPPPKSE